MSRNTLHPSNVEAFKDWAVGTQGQKILPPRGQYELFRMARADGNGVELVFYFRDRSDHITAPRGTAENMVYRWLRERSRQRASSSSSPSAGGSSICDDPPTTSPPWD